MSPTPNSTLDDPQKIIADLKRQLAESNAERDQALEQQTATAEVLQVINSSPGDLAPVFDAILEKAMRLCGAVFGELHTYDGERFHTAALRGVPTAYAAVRENSSLPTRPGTGGAKLLQQRRPVHTLDLMAEDIYRDGDPGRRAIVDLGGARTSLTVPLLKDEVVLGGIVIYRQEVRPFSDKQIALLENFAAQAVIAMENARLLTETREALEQQTATAEVLQVINSSPGNLAPVFDAMLEKATRLCEAPFGILRTWDGERFHFGAVHGDPQFCDWVRQRGPIRPDRDASLLGRIQSGERIVRVADAQDDEGFRASSGFREMAEASGIRSTVTVALHKDDALLGIITVYRQEVRPFSDKQVALLQNFAAQAVIAIENARLITETREALEQQTATAEVLGVINSSPGDLAPVFEAMLEKATRLCEAPFGTLRTWDGERFHFGAVYGDPQFSDWVRRRGSFHPDGGPSPLRRIMEGEQVVQVADASNDAGYSTSPGFREMVEASGMRSVITVALRKDEALLGTIHVYRQEVRPFTDKQVALLENFAVQAVIAMENARLITETREALEQQTATAEVLQTINASPGDLAPVFDAILEKAHTLCDAATGSLRIIDGDMICAVAFRGQSGEFADRAQQGYPFASAPLLASLRDGAPFVHISDVWERDDLISQLSTASGNRTILAVPLRKDDALLGMIVAGRKEVRPFTDKQIGLLRNFAAQAVIAMENARLITETREALEQQTATAEVLQIINSSPGDLDPVFAAMLEKALRLCGGAFGMMNTFNGESWRRVADHGTPAAYAKYRRQNPQAVYGPDTAPGRLIAGEDVVHNVDLMAEEAYARGEPNRRALVDLGGARTFLSVALQKGTTLLGNFAIYRQEVRPFSDKQIALLQNFAAQAVIAMENARLLGELRQRTEEVGELNRDLEVRVAAQVDELGRVGRLKRFLAPQLAELIVSQGDEKILESHRREIVVVFCDLRGYTAFTETAEPEEVLEFLRQYHGALGPLVSQFEGTLDQFSGDGIMVFFNDPVPCPDPAARAVKMAMAMREAARELIAAWSRHGCELGFGIGIAQGFATLGQIGFSERSGYTAIGTVCNLAARLCAEAKDGQILVSSRIAEAVEAVARLEDLGNLELKGLRRPVAAFNVVQGTSLAEARPNLTVVARGPGA